MTDTKNLSPGSKEENIQIDPSFLNIFVYQLYGEARNTADLDGEYIRGITTGVLSPNNKEDRLEKEENRKILK